MRGSEQAAALRHVVYRELLFRLPPASVIQAEQFASNLSLYRFADTQPKRSRIDRVLIWLCVSPDIATATNYRKPTLGDIGQKLAAKFGDRLADVAGFYRHKESGRWKLNLPKGCVLHAYKSRVGFFAGFLCQPLSQIDKYFLLTSAAFGGPKAIRLEETDRQFFEQYKEPRRNPMPSVTPVAINAAELGQNIATL